MKPCSRNQKEIAWLVLGELETERTGALRRHIQTCDGCRRYFNELSAITGRLSAPQANTDLAATASLHRRVVNRIRASEPAAVHHTLTDLIRTMLLNWRIAGPVLGGIAVLVALLFTSPPQSPVPPSAARQQATSSGKVAGVLPPTIANYQMVANESLDKLDELLTQQGRRNLPRVPTFTAAMGTGSMSE